MQKKPPAVNRESGEGPRRAPPAAALAGAAPRRAAGGRARRLICGKFLIKWSYQRGAARAGERAGDGAGPV